MKLCRLYSNNEKFKEIIFNDGFNVVLGEITNENYLNSDSHNLGKSTIISLIDFMLLKNMNSNNFLKLDIFNSYIFYLEIRINSGDFVTIKRPVSRNTKISLKKHTKEIDAREGITWDYEDLSLGANQETQNPKYILNMWLGFDVLSDENYRKTAGYFLRTQDDYGDVFRLGKSKGTDSSWKPILFEILGFDSKHMKKKYQIEKKLDDKKKLLEDIRNEYKVDYSEKDKLKGLIDIAEANRERIKEWLDKFDFYQEETGLDKELIEEVEAAISEYNTQRYNLEYELQEIEKSLKVKAVFDLEEIQSIYEEVGIFFPEYVSKTFEDLIDFNKKLSNERMKYLGQVKEKKKEKLKCVIDTLKELNEKRKVILKNLKDTNTFSKYNAYREELIGVEREIQRYLTEMENADTIGKIQKDMNDLEIQLDIEKNELNKQIEESTSIYTKVRKDFYEFVREILDDTAVISLRLNGMGNVDFSAAFYNTYDIETAQGFGHTYKKILCACFDLAVVKNYMDKSFYRFIYHDGCLESLDPRKRKKYLDLVRRISAENNIQYILTCLSSEIPDGQEYVIRDQEIAVKLSDLEDDSGRLFGFKF